MTPKVERRPGTVARRAPSTCLYRTAALVVQPSALLGVARLLDLGSNLNRNLYNYAETNEEADAWALWRDWAALGDDMKQVYESNGVRFEILRPLP